MTNVTVHDGTNPSCTLCAHPEPLAVDHTRALVYDRDGYLTALSTWQMRIAVPGDDAGAARVDWLAWLAVLGIVAAMAVGGALTGTAW